MARLIAIAAIILTIAGIHVNSQFTEDSSLHRIYVSHEKMDFDTLTIIGEDDYLVPLIFIENYDDSLAPLILDRRFEDDIEYNIDRETQERQCGLYQPES